MHQPQRVEKAKILIANTPMDTDKIKVFGSRVKVDNIAKVSVCILIAYIRKILLRV
jgi:T-complex protein 1 subunit beta